MHGAQVDVDMGGVRGSRRGLGRSGCSLYDVVTNVGESPLRVALCRPFPFFFDGAAAKKNQKTAFESFAPAGATRALPLEPANF